MVERSYPETAEVAFPRWWIQQIRDQLFTWDRLPSGPLGDWAFLFREQLNDKLSQPVDPAQGSPDRGAPLERLRELADLLNDPASKRREYYAPLLCRFREELPPIIKDLSVSRPHHHTKAD